MKIAVIPARGGSKRIPRMTSRAMNNGDLRESTQSSGTLHLPIFQAMSDAQQDRAVSTLSEVLSN